jgi:hypothetical protein
MQPRRLNIYLVWNHLTAVAAFLLTALINVAAAGPTSETQLSGSHSKQIEATAGLVREVLAAAAKADGNAPDGDGEHAVLASQPALYLAAVLPLSSLPAGSNGRREAHALRSGLTRAPPSV